MARQYRAQTFKGTTRELAEFLTEQYAQGWHKVDLWTLNEANAVNDQVTKFGILLASDQDGEDDVVLTMRTGDEVI
jgi:hypothetical protein